MRTRQRSIVESWVIGVGCAVLWIIGVSVAVVQQGCESPGSDNQAASDPVLFAMASEQNQDLAAAFGVEPFAMHEASINWGAMSATRGWSITISDHDLSGWTLDENVRHEMFHVLSVVVHDGTMEFNGVRIGDVVESWY